MAVKALIFGTDDLYPQLKPFYDMEVQRGNLEIVGHAVLENDKCHLYNNSGGGFQVAIISSKYRFYRNLKWIESFGVPRNKIIDGRVFQIQNLDFNRLIQEGTAYNLAAENPFKINYYTIHPIVYKFSDYCLISVNTKSYIESANITGSGLIEIGKFCAMSWDLIFRIGENNSHDYRKLTTYEMGHLDWLSPREFFKNAGLSKIKIGSDVWCGRNVIFKSMNPDKPLVVGDGAVIAADSVVVKNVPPYAIVGGNPAKIIKYRFSEDVIESLLRIKWWDWDIDKIYENYKYFNRVDEFVAMHDK